MNTTFEVGTPVVNPYGTEGFISAVLKPEAKTYVIGRGMAEVLNEYEVCYSDGRITTLADGIIAPFVARAAHMPKVEDVEARRAEIERLQSEKRARDTAEREDLAARQRAFNDEAKERTPSWAKSVIVAKLVEDKSDWNSDYFGSTTKRTVILGFSPHTRDLFPEMRKFAATFPETAHLADAPESAEHREKYSMGSGFYLKEGRRDGDGWKVQKEKFYGDSRNVPFGEWHIAEPETAKPAKEIPTSAAPNGATGLRIEEHTHTKKGFQMFIAILPDRVDRSEFDRLRTLAESLNGWYSRPWGKTPGGFAFKLEANAKAFAGEAQPAETLQVSIAAIDNVSPQIAAVADQIAKVQTTVNNAQVAKFRVMADKLQADIDNKFQDRRANTPKQQREAASARIEGWRLTRTQEAMRAIADHLEAGTLPAILANVKSKADVYELCRSHIDRTNAGYYDAGIDTDKPANDTEQARAIWALLGGKSEADKKAESLQAKIDSLKFSKIAGYFPTPKAVIARMLEAAKITEESPMILEPEAGSGAIVSYVKEEIPGATVHAFECNHKLREILALQGVELIGEDFMQATAAPQYDYVLMNPPFENGQDGEHVRHAFQFLKSGGRLVAIMSPGPFFRQDRKAVAFREWFEEYNGHKVDLPAGAFKESGTGVSTVLIVIDK